MKKMIALILTGSLILSVAMSASAFGAPAKKSKTSAKAPTKSTALYKDGTYDVKHKSVKPGYEEAVVVIKGGKIQSITLKRLGDNKIELNYAGWDGTSDRPNLKQFRLDLAKAMMAKQSAKVDTISGATDSSNGWIAAVTDALKQAKK